MAEGVAAVMTALNGAFGSVQLHIGHDVRTREVVLDFRAEGRDFTVRVSREFDEDYASGQVQVDLHRLSSVLRSSKEGRARVLRTGISASDPS